MYLAQCFLVIVTAGVYFLRKLIRWRSVPSSLLMWAHWSFCFNITAAALLTFIPSPPPQNHTISTVRTQTRTHTTPLRTDDTSLCFTQAPVVWKTLKCTISKYAVGVMMCHCLWKIQVASKLLSSQEVSPRQGAFCLSAAAVSSFIELEFIIQPFFCVMSYRAEGRWRRAKERGGLATAQECIPIG